MTYEDVVHTVSLSAPEPVLSPALRRGDSCYSALSQL
jgi:hypothetical protein